MTGEPEGPPAAPAVRRCLSSNAPQRHIHTVEIRQIHRPPPRARDGPRMVRQRVREAEPEKLAAMEALKQRLAEQRGGEGSGVGFR